MPKITKRTWSKEEESILYEYYPSDLKKCMELLSKRSESSIYGMARKLKIKRDLLWKDEDIQFLKLKYSEFGAIYCAEILNKKAANIRQFAIKLNLKVSKEQISRSRSESLLNFQNNKPNNDFRVNVEQFINIKIKEVAYFLGYFWADGYIQKEKSNSRRASEIRLEIAKEDYESIKHIFDKIGDWSVYFRQRQKHHKEVAIICTNNRNLLNFLKENGYSEKSHSSANKIISKIPIELRPLFFRGLIDGDGHVRFDPKYYSKLITITSTIEQDWSYVEDVIKSLNIKYAIYKHIGKKGAYSIVSVNGDNALTFGKYLYDSYEEDNIGLNRKYLKFKEMSEFVRIKKQIIYPITEEEIKSVELYKQGICITKICSIVNRTYRTVNKYLLKNNINYYDSKIKEFDLKKHKIILMLKNGIDEKQISLDLKTSIKTIKKCMEDLKKSLN